MSKIKKSGARKWRLGLLAGVSSIAVFASCAPAFAAADAETKAEIRALKEQLKRLEKRLESQAQSQRQTERKVERVEATVEAPPPPGSPVRVVSKDGAPWPTAFYYKAVTVTPGGFFEFGALHRDHYIGADIATPFGQIPFPNNPTSHEDETRFTARRSRFILQTDANLDENTHVKEYLAADFLSAAQTATLTQSDSFNFRFRELYAQVDRSDFGVHIMAGQAYSLIGLNSRGTTADTFITPPVIDDQYMPGFTWSRQPGIRLSKDIGPDFQVAISAEAAYTSFAAPAAGFNNLIAPYPGTSIPGAYNQVPVSGSLYNSLNSVTMNDVPDLIAKAAWDPTVLDRTIHLEAGGIMRNFTDRVYWGNHDTWGGGAEVGVIVPIIPKMLDFQASGLAGNGIGRYGAASLPDSTFSWTGATQTIHERQVMIGLTAHVTPKTDVYLFAGGEFASPQYNYMGYAASTPFIAKGLYSYGYGNPATMNLGCNFEGAAPVTLGVTPACAAQTKDVRQITSGFWHNFYDGPAGKIRVGMQYSYTIRDSFQGIGGAFKGTENMFFTSLRYYPFN